MRKEENSGSEITKLKDRGSEEENKTRNEK